MFVLPQGGRLIPSIPMQVTLSLVGALTLIARPVGSEGCEGYPAIYNYSYNPHRIASTQF